jgi:membrane protease YdiL (CAAX protease family)
VCYELAAFSLAGDAIAGVRNGADVLLKSLFVGLGGRRGLLVFDLLLLAVGLTLVLRDRRRNPGPLQPRIFGGMLAEAIVGGLVFGVIAGALTAVILRDVPRLLILQVPALSVPTQLTVALGAGIYEELLFRVLLVGGLAVFARRVLGWRPMPAGVLAALVGATIFSAFHYIGPYGDPFSLPTFVFRLIAGLLFSAMYLVRGFGITAWTHALYDVFLILAM